MYRIFRSEKDAYITNRIIKNISKENSNTGKAGTIDLYKLYGVTKSGSLPNTELTRGLIKFNLSDLIDDYNSGLIDITSQNFNCYIKLFDVYGGQSTPTNYTLCIHPLSRSFQEGIGRDVVFYGDYDACNFLSSSYNSVWFTSGANEKGTLGSSTIDVISSGNLGAGIVPLWKTQSFTNGDENLEIDITNYVSGILCGLLPDYGFRISFVDSEETDQQTRFVKRFATKDAADPTKHPQCIIKYNDSVQANNSNFIFDYEGTLFFYNKVRGTTKNIISSSNEITGTNCIALTLKTEMSGGQYSLVYSGSQHAYAGNYIQGVYSSSFTISSTDTIIKNKILESGSVKFDIVWGSTDGTLGYYTASNGITVSMPTRDGNAPNLNLYNVSAINIATEYKLSDKARIKIHINDINKPYVMLTKTPFISPSTIPDRVYFSIKDSISGEVIIPFDDEYDSTKLSSDSTSLWFDLHMANLYNGRLYEIDIMIIENNLKQYYRNIAHPFKISSIT